MPGLATPVFTAAATTTTPVFDVYETGNTCTYPDGTTTTDSEAYAEQYTSGAKTYTNYELACVAGNTGSTSDTHAEYPPKSCYDGTERRHSAAEQASFADGEAVYICDKPDGTATTLATSRTKPYTFYKQGFACESTVGTGKADANATAVHNKDSIEFDQTYVRNRKHFMAITTGCVGTVPASKTVATTIVSHELGCSMYNPFAGGSIRGYGESFTFPDRQFEEICQVPDYQTPAAS